MKNTVRAAATLGGAALIAGLIAIPASATPSAGTISHLVHTHGLSQSSNWSGYAQTNGGYTSASANWTVPTVAPTSDNRYSSTWVGIDGDGNSNLIQTGTEEDSINGQARYYAWWEILPASETRIGMQVSPGDSMSASVSQVSGSTWAIHLADNSTGQAFNT
ncbi:MAG: G1 family glutamic endopeptidase, partial [Sciscionella sp.]